MGQVLGDRGIIPPKMEVPRNVGFKFPSPPEYGIAVSTGLRESIFPAAQLAWTSHVFLISNGCGRKRAMTDALTNVKKKLQDEITTLEHEMNVDLPKELMKARAHGDLSENAEFKYAKERQGYVSARLGQLKKRLGDIGMLNLTNIPADRAGYGSRVWVLDIKKSVEVEYKLVTTEEADAAQGLISKLRPSARRCSDGTSAMKCGYRRPRESRNSRSC